MDHRRRHQQGVTSVAGQVNGLETTHLLLPPNFPSSSGGGGKQQQQEATHSAEVPKVKKPPRTRPKLTPDLLLSNDGLGYVPHASLKGPWSRGE